jgi:pimeloyl-ACP methyl ester carboxylesterase
MVESLSGQAYGGFRPTAPGEVAAFHDPRTFVPHDFREQSVDLGEIVMNYAQAGSSSNPPLLLIPGQTESWWGYEKAMPILAQDFHVFAVDLRGQGRSSWTPGRYTLDNMGGDLVRFIATVIQRPVVTSGCSSGGLLSAWLSAFALPGQIRGAVYEDPPLFSSETSPMVGQSIKQAIGHIFRLNAIYLGDQWRVGDWEGMKRAAAVDPSPLLRGLPRPAEPPQNLKEYDPEWGRAFWEGTVSRSLPHELLLSKVKTPVLLTHHGRFVNPENGSLFGAMSDLQAVVAQKLLTEAGVAVQYASLPDAAHAMHAAEPERFAALVSEWAKALPA